jgi:hypothetical protein
MSSVTERVKSTGPAAEATSVLPCLGRIRPPREFCGSKDGTGGRPGCGPGHTAPAAPAAAQVIGIDVTPKWSPARS